ncbi:hypothetical protein FHS29_002983 [Saccharothrix tamanrassetensis]|uniref:Uncharacterized protein n=1 Tax=Saccharothrix tamanrassetensis TaxID=1051531 RepID=A0A841CJW3_9PSEU|nr:hypothetical protein [Saccharothrix tamanrassetensis]MBB5956397.1 hypothetical protein [Saccharothrix tamanrassetensis]
MSEVGGVHGSALGFAGGVVATVVAGNWSSAALVLLTAVVLAVSLITTPVGAALTAVQCWGLYGSFVIGSAGHFVPDWSALAVLAVAGTASLSGLARDRAAAPSPVRS